MSIFVVFCFIVADLPAYGRANTSTRGINARSKSRPVDTSVIAHYAVQPFIPNDDHEAAFINNDSPFSSEWF